MHFSIFHFATVLTLILVIIATSSDARGKRARARDMYRNQNDELVTDDRFSSRRSHRKKSDKPNIVIIMTDDQDKELGSMNFMPKTMKIMGQGGATFNNAFVTTPMCCPSRSSFLTGMYPHNHNVYTNNDNCSSIQWQQTHETRNFATYLSNAGYRTGYFGKYLNEYNGTYIPPGWREWVGLIRNSRFYNYMINFNGQKIRHENDYYKDYFTDLIANDSVTFLKQSKRYFPNRPVAMVLSMPAPHGPEDAAPQYQHLFENVTAHRTPSWNYAPNPDKQWILQYTGKMEPIHIAFTDILMRKRLQTLQSVDDAVEKVYTELKNLGELDNTYIIYTSDHGYHLGQYGLIKGKAMPYEFDTRVPFYVRGPGIEGGMSMNEILTNIDIAPTVLEMAGINIPEHIDGKPFFKLLLSKKEGSENFSPHWRDTVLIERGKINGKNVKIREQIEYHSVPGLKKEARLAKECQDPAFKAPCKPKQKWVCTQLPDRRWRKTKCRLSDVVSNEKQARCICPPKKMRKDERRNQKQFLKNFVNQPSMLTGTKFIKTRSGRSIDDNELEEVDHHMAADHAITTLETVVTHYVQKRGANRRRKHDNWQFGLQSDTPEGSLNYRTLCTVGSNNTVACDRSIYSSKQLWKIHKDEVNKLIEHYKEKINMLKEIREHLRIGKPSEAPPAFGVTNSNKRGGRIPTTSETFPEFPESSADKDYSIPQNHIYTTDVPPTSSSVVIGKGEDCVCEDASLNESVGDIVENTVVPRPSRKPKKERRKNRKNNKRHKKRKNKDVTRDCHQFSMKCFTHDNDHWQTPPLWNLGPFCFCPNSNNNTYWCIRTINSSHNFLYCEFITGFISYYDLNRDPYQLRNAVHDLEYWTLQQYHKTLNRLRACSGPRECTIRSGHYTDKKDKSGRHGRRPPANNHHL